jgi:hypothetical protein
MWPIDDDSGLSRDCGTLYHHPKRKLREVLCGFWAHVAPNECPVAGRTLKFGLSMMYSAEIRFVQLID